MSKQKKQKYGSVQEQYVYLREVLGPVARLDLPSGPAYRSVVEVTGTHLNLFDESKQQEIHELYHQLYTSLDHSIQIIIRIRALDIEAYLQYVDGPDKTQEWQALASSHAEMLRGLTKQSPLLGRRFYIVLPAEEELEGLSRWEKGQDTLTLTQAAQTLRSRTETLTYHLQSIGISCRLLTNRRLAEFYKSFFSPASPHIHGGVVNNGFALEDVIAPRMIAAQKDHLQLEHTQPHIIEYMRVEKIAKLPRLVSFGWLKQLIETDETFDIIHNIVPKAQALSYLRRQQTHAQASLLRSAGSGRTMAPDANIAHNDLEPLVESVGSGEQTMLDSSLHLIIRSNSKEELERKARRINQRANVVFHAQPRIAYYEQAQAFRACLPGMMAARDPLLLPSASIASMIPFFDHFIFKPSETAILEGITQHNEPVILDWWADLPNANRLILGPTGWGKSYKAKLDIMHTYTVYKRLAQRLHKPNDGFQILIIDPERENSRAPGFNLVERFNGQSIRFSPGSAHKLNPLDLPVASDDQEKEDILANHIQRTHKILDLMLAHNTEDRASTLNPQEKSLLDAALYEAYREVGITSDRATHTRPAPLLRDLHQILENEFCGPDTTNLAQRLRRYTNGSLAGLFSDRTNIDLTNTVIQFDVKELDSELRPIALLLTAQFIWNVAFSNPIPRFLFIDELATVTRYKAGKEFVEELFQRARKHYVSVTGMTQQPQHLSTSIIANCAEQILLHQNDTTIDSVAELFKLSGREVQRVRGFDKGEALLLANGKRMQVRFIASPLEDRLITTNRRQIDKLEAAVAAASAPPVIPVPVPVLPVVPAPAPVPLTVAAALPPAELLEPKEEKHDE